MADQAEYRLDEIEIVARDSLPPDLLPSILTPIFRLRQPPHDLIMASYRIEGDKVIGGALDSEDTLEEMVWLKDAVRLPQPIEPLVDHVLWIDKDYHVYYQPQADVLDRLRRHAEQCVAEARDALQQRRYNVALSLAQTAISADENCYDAVVVKSIVYKLWKNTPFVDELRNLARAIDPDKDFDEAVNKASWVLPSPASAGPAGWEAFQTDIKQFQPVFELNGYKQAVPV